MKEDEQHTQRCSTCGSRSDPLYDQEASKMTYIFVMLTLVFLGLWSILVIPLIVQATKTMVKRCYDCSTILEKHELFSVPSFNDKILNFRFGSCAIILSRKYAYILIALFIIVYCLIISRKEPQIDILEESKYSPKTWEDFVSQCGKEVYIQNGMKAKSNYMKYYENKIINWNGVYMYQKETNKLIQNTRNGIYLKMIPSDAIDDIPDIVLALEEKTFQKYKDQIYELKNGDVIEFEAKIEHMGEEFSYHSVRLVNFSKTGRNVQIQSISSKDSA